MATNQFKPFASGVDANITPQNEWENLPAVRTGFQAGKASSAQVNKALRQASFVAAALAQYIANTSGKDVLDDGNIEAFMAMMIEAFGKDFQKKSVALSALSGLPTGKDQLPYFNNDSSAAQTPLTKIGRDLISAPNLADLFSYLGLGNASTKDVGTSRGTVAAGDDSRIVGAMQKSSNGSDIADAATFRNNLGLGDSATKNVGTSAGSVAAGNDSRITGAMQKDNNGADIPNVPLFQQNIGLGAVQSSYTDPSALLMRNGGWGLGITNQNITGTMQSFDVTKFDYFDPSKQNGPLPGRWVGGFTHAMNTNVGWQLMALGLGTAGENPRLFTRMLVEGNKFSATAELYHTLNKPTAADVGAMPANTTIVQGIRYGAETIASLPIPGTGQEATFSVPAGSSITALTNFSSGTFVSITKVGYRPLQVNINGTWMNVSA